MLKSPSQDFRSFSLMQLVSQISPRNQWLREKNDIPGRSARKKQTRSHIQFFGKCFFMFGFLQNILRDFQNFSNYKN